MAFDFPSSPTPGQTFFDPASGARYTFTNGAWLQVASSPVLKGTTGDAPPNNPDPGQLWWESDTGRMFIYYNDGNSTQWVQISGPLQQSVGVFKISSGVISTPQATLDIAFPTGFTAFQLTLALVPVTSGGTLSLRYSTDGTTFDGSANYQYGGNVSAMSGSPTNTAQGALGAASILVFGLVGQAASAPASAFLDFPVNPFGVQFVTWRGAYWNGTSYFNSVGSGYHGTLLAPLKAVRFYSGAGNIASGMWQLNGVK